LTNGLSFLILAITYPIWDWFRKKLKAKWLKKQPKRYENIDIEHIPNPFDIRSWIKTGLSWGAFMFLIMSIGFPYFNGQKKTLKNLILGLVIWTIGGLGFGYTMKLFMNKTISKKNENIVANNV
jgi:hypothetical protein